MKKLLAVLLAAVMLASAAALCVNAEILYEDDFEDEEFDLYDHSTGEGFWFSNKDTGAHGMGKFEETGGTLNGFDDALFGLSCYWDDKENGYNFADEWPMSKSFTVWTDVKVDESGISEVFGAGLNFEDWYDQFRGYQSGYDTYSFKYFAVDNEQQIVNAEGETVPHTSFVRLFAGTERVEKNYPDHVYGEMDIEGDPYFNINGDPIKIGVRYGYGNITGYVNGKIAASYDRNTIGLGATPVVWLHNIACYVEYDNLGVGTYDHDVKEMTRPENYALYEGKVIVMDGENVAGEIKAAEDDALSIEAPKVSGRKFVKWESVTVGDFEINAENAGKAVWTNNIERLEDFENEITISYKERAELLYGIEIGSFDEAKFSITMPDTDIVLKAVYEDGGDEPGPSDFTPGDANGDGKLNAKDVTAIMKHLVGATPANFVEKAADYDGSGTINAKDVTKLMKFLVS